MPSDRSRTSDDLSQNYKAVMTQQGRVIVDRDFTALLNTIQESFDTAKLGQMDMYTDDLGDMVDFTQPARPFEPLPTLGRPPSSFFVPPGQSTPPDTE